jgi:hypothetical protein
MAVRFHLVEDVFNLAVGTDKERGPLDAQRRFAVHVLFFDHVVGVADLLVLVGKQGERQIIFVLEFFLLVGRVGRYTQNNRLYFLEIREAFAELASFDGSARGVGLWEKVENNVLSAIVFKRYLLAIIVGKDKIRSLVAGFGHLSIASCGARIAPEICGVKCYTENRRY